MKSSNAPRHPFVGLALVAAIGIILADFFPVISYVALNVVAAGALVALLWPSSPRTYAVVAAGFFLLHGFHVRETPGLKLSRELGEGTRVVTAIGIVASEPKISESGFGTFLLRLHSIQLEEKQIKTKATVRARWRGAAKLGDEVQLFGTIEPLPPPRNPGEFDMRSHFARRDVRSQLLVRFIENGSVVRHSGGNRILRAAENARAWMENVLSWDLEDAAVLQGLISGITLGSRHDTEQDIEQPFQQTGTLHLFAVSGLNVAILAQLLWVLATVVRLTRRWTVLLIIPTLFFYAAVTGLQTSSVRAAVMTSVLLGGFFVERKVFALNSLAAAAFLILLWDTNELFSIGFQLSFAVVVAILFLEPPIFRLLRRLGALDPFLPRALLRHSRRFVDRCVGWICRGASVSLAAWIGSLPLILWYFHLVTPISLLANLVVVPIAFFILAIALLSLLAAPLAPWVSIIFNNANWALAKAMLALVNMFAQFPGSHYYVAHPHWPSGARVEMTVLDYGAGAAVHVRSRDANWLFDCGSERGYEWLLRPYLHSRGIKRLSGLALTHGDSLHIGGALGVINDFAPALLLDNPLPDRSSVHRTLQRELAARGQKSQPLVAGSEIRLSRHVLAKILHPPALALASTADEQAVVAQLIIDSRIRVLLASDIGDKTEAALCANYADLRSDILVKGQHHSKPSGSEQFLEAVQPKLIIATSRDFPEAERLKEDWCESVRAKGIKLFRQDESGAVELRFFRESWEASAYLTGEPFRSSSR